MLCSSDTQDQQRAQPNVEAARTTDGQVVGATNGQGVAATDKQVAEATDAEAARTRDESGVENTNKRLTSEVWIHFKKQRIDGVDKAVCNYCKKKLSGVSKNGTTHLHEHYRKCMSKNNQDIRQLIWNPRQEKKMDLFHLLHTLLIRLFQGKNLQK